MTRLELASLVPVMARATASYPFKRWGFGESIAMEALLAAGGEPAEFAAGLVTDWALDHQPLVSEPLAHVAPGVPLLELAERGGDSADRLLDCARELASIFEHSAVGEHGAQIHRPDLAGWEHEVWVDCMHLDGPFLSQLALITGEKRYAELAKTILLGHARILQDEQSGLFSHGFNDLEGNPNRIHWGRGQGWALLGLMDTVKNLPVGDLVRIEATQRFEAQVAGIAANEVEPGEWRTVVDAPETAVESSVAAFVALAVERGIRHGLIPDKWRPLADRAWDATFARITPDGFLPGVSDATPVGADAAHYDGRARGTFPWGQGPALLAAIDRMDTTTGME
jgi:unsaturated rhamnogalacturonyl hydrolase